MIRYSGRFWKPICLTLFSAILASGYAGLTNVPPAQASAAKVNGLKGSPSAYRGEVWSVAQNVADLLQEYYVYEANDWSNDCGECFPNGQSIADMNAVQRTGLQYFRQLQSIEGRYRVTNRTPTMYVRPIQKLVYALVHLDSAAQYTHDDGYGSGDFEGQKAELSVEGAWRALKNIR